MTKYENYSKALKESIGDAEKLAKLEADIQADTELSNLQRNKLKNSVQTHLKMAVGEKTLKTDTAMGENIVATTKKLDNVETVGFLCLPTVSESIENLGIPNDELDKYWNDNKIPQDFKPKPHREKDSFKKACDDFKGAKPVSDIIRKLFPNASKVVWDITPLSPTEYQITRKIVSYIGDDKKKDKMEMHTLSHDNICKIIMDETTTEIPTKKGKTKKQTTYRYRSIPDRKAYDKLTNEIFDEFLERVELYKNITSGKKVRDGIRDTIKAHKGINFSGQGGTWFVPNNAENIMAQYQDFFKWADANYTDHFGKCRLFVLPLINDIDVQQQIEEDVMRTVEHNMDKLLDNTLQQLSSAENDTEIDSILARKLAEHEQNVDMLNEYRTLLKKKLNVHVEHKNITNARTKRGELSGRQKALLERMKYAESKE